MPVYGVIDEKALGPLLRDATVLSIGAGRIVFHEDDQSETVLQVLSGVARLYRSFPDARRQVIGFAMPGDFLGLSFAQQRAFTAEALNTMQLRRFPSNEFSAYVRARPSLMRDIHAIAARALTHAHLQLTVMGRGLALERVAWFLLEAQLRLSEDGRTSRVPMPMTRQDMADYLGLTLETVSRCVSLLKRQRVIDTGQAAIFVLNNARLSAIAAQAAG